MKPVLIGLTGLAGAGKSTVARRLVDEHGYTRLRFAAPLKRMIGALLAAQGVGFAEQVRMLEGDLKEVPSPHLAGRTPRQAMQWLGTEWGRDLMGPSFWCDAFAGVFDQTLLEATADLVRPRIVVDDLRFLNEAAMILQRGGRVVLVRRAVLRGGGTHASEAGGLPFDRQIENDGTIADLMSAVDRLAEEMQRVVV